jgi:hypothetical protein
MNITDPPDITDPTRTAKRATNARPTGNYIIDTTTGKVVNLVSNDVMRFDNFFPFMHLGWTAIVEMLVVVHHHHHRHYTTVTPQ